MPGKGGYRLIGRVRALPPERGGTIPAAALTGLVGAEHIEKPVNVRTLLGVVAILTLEE